MSLSDRAETCPLCLSALKREYEGYHIVGAKAEDAFWSHALGKVVTSRRLERMEATSKGLEEVGNEDLKKHIKPKQTDYPTIDELHKLGALDGLSG